MKSANNKKCKETKRLVRLAIENGLTNRDIAIKARVSAKSTALVSRWRNGESLATEFQMQSLMKEFGEQLRRKSEHLLTVEQKCKQYFIKLTGELIVKHVVRERVYANKKHLNIALHRFLIFRQNDSYYIVSQSRKGVDSSYSINADIIKGLSHCDNEDANWISKGTPNLLSLEELLQCIDSFAAALAESRLIPNKEYTFSGQELQFSIRRYLMREGIQLADVIDISSQS